MYIHQCRPCDDDMKTSLFWIIGGISEYAGKEAADDTIATFHNHAVGVCVHEVVIEEEEPNLLHEVGGS